MSAISANLATPPDNFSTTLSSGITDSDLTIPLTSVTGLPTEGVGVIFTKDINGDVNVNSVEIIHWTGVSGSSLTLTDTGDRGLTGSYSGAQAFSAGAYFEVWITSYYYASLKAGIAAIDIAALTAAASAKATPIDADSFPIVDSADSNALKKTTIGQLKTVMATLPLNAPQGFLINGKIAVTDAAGITVAIKTLAGTDPSATDPVYVRIGDTVRSITSALSVVKADGTNWCNAGSSELATKEIDYFVYLGYNATDGVVIGFSRFPGANSYDDFSTTSTNEKYCAISTITNAAATDYYEVIGRFAATLSAGAGYTWSVPTYTAKNLIQRPIYETRELTWLPTYTGFSSNTTTGKYRIVGNRMLVMAFVPTGTSNAAGFTYTLPFTAQTQELFACYVTDNGTAISPPGRAYTAVGSATVLAGKVVNADAGFTASGTKSIYQPTFNLSI